MHVLIENLLQFSECYPEELIRALMVIEKKENKQLYVVGGTVRDLLQGSTPTTLISAYRKGPVILSVILSDR